MLFVFQPRASRWFTLCGRWTSAPSVRCETRTSSTWYVVKEGNVLFNDAFNTFYLPLYGVRHMVKDHSDSGRGNLLLPHRLQQGFFYMHHPTDRMAHTTAFVTPVVEHWLELEIAQWVHPMKDRSDDPSHHERTLLPRIVHSELCQLTANYRSLRCIWTNI